MFISANKKYYYLFNNLGYLSKRKLIELYEDIFMNITDFIEESYDLLFWVLYIPEMIKCQTRKKYEIKPM